MESDGAITHAQAEQARAAPLGLHIAQRVSAVAPWFQEEVRRELDKHFGSEEVHEAGLRVNTTLDLDLQQVANRAVAEGVAAYERRRGWTGKLENVLASGEALDSYRHPDWAVTAAPGDYIHALVTRGSRLRFRHASARRVRQAPILSFSPRTGNGPASATATRSPSPATSFSSA